MRLSLTVYFSYGFTRRHNSLNILEFHILKFNYSLCMVERADCDTLSALGRILFVLE